jgi:hypothetical protein
MRRLAVAVLLLAGACGEDDGPSPAPLPRVMWVSSRWEWAAKEAAPGLTFRVELWTNGYVAQRAQDCVTLPRDLRVFVNDRPAEVIDPAGPQLGGLSGTEFRGCKRGGFAEAGPFTPEEARAVEVRVEEGGTVAVARLGSAVVEPRLGPVPAQVKLGDELVLPVFFDTYVTLGHAEITWQEGGATRRSASLVRSPDLRHVHLRMVGGPGPVQVTISGGYSETLNEIPMCQGFSNCELWRTPIVGPVSLEVVP